MLRRILIPLVLAAGLIVPATASAAQVTATHRGKTAVLSWEGSTGHFRDLKLTITKTKSGKVVYTTPIKAPMCGTLCWPALRTGQPAISFQKLAASTAQDVVINLYSGGANCCFVTQVFHKAPGVTGAWSMLAGHDFGSAGAQLRTIRGIPAFVSANPAFSTAFTDFADSGSPVQVLRLLSGKFVDVTGQYPSLVSADAAKWLTAFHKAKGKNDVGLIAAWVADEATLHHGTSALAYVRQQASEGNLNSSFGAGDSGTRFVTKLQALLKREGYLH
jgi:hypothetical protein